MKTTIPTAVFRKRVSNQHPSTNGNGVCKHEPYTVNQEIVFTRSQEFHDYLSQHACIDKSESEVLEDFTLQHLQGPLQTKSTNSRLNGHCPGIEIRRLVYQGTTYTGDGAFPACVLGLGELPTEPGRLCSLVLRVGAPSSDSFPPVQHPNGLDRGKEKGFFSRHYSLSHLETALLSPAIPRIHNLVERFFADLSALCGRPLSYEKFRRYLSRCSTAEYLDEQIEEASRPNTLRPWVLLMRALYDRLPALWARIPAEERKIFADEYLIHFANYFGGFPLVNALALRRMLAVGRLEVIGGFTRVETAPKGFVIHCESGDYPVDALFNASGLGSLAENQPLYARLIQKKLLSAHPSGGLRVVPATLQTLDQAGAVNETLFALGEATKSSSLGVNAIARLVVQADTVAEQMSRRISITVTESITQCLQ